MLELEKISLINDNLIPKLQEFPSLPQLTHEEVSSLQVSFSSNKAVGEDGTSDIWIKNTKFIDLISNWWNPKSLEAIGGLIFQCRLVPLNKEYPSLPEAHQFRPIAILTSSFKWLEARFRN